MDKLITLIDEGGIICPLPIYWNELYKIIVGSLHALESKGLGVTQITEKFGIPPPLILGAWWEVSDEEKKERFLLHITIAAKNDRVLKKVEEFLFNLDEDKFYYDRGGQN